MSEPAYPNRWNCNPGLTKRELFAAMAMQGLLANSTVKNGVNDPDEICVLLAQGSVMLADALIAELSTPAEGEASE